MKRRNPNDDAAFAAAAAADPSFDAARARSDIAEIRARGEHTRYDHASGLEVPLQGRVQWFSHGGSAGRGALVLSFPDGTYTIHNVRRANPARRFAPLGYGDLSAREQQVYRKLAPAARARYLESLEAERADSRREQRGVRWNPDASAAAMAQFLALVEAQAYQKALGFPAAPGASEKAVTLAQDLRANGVAVRELDLAFSKARAAGEARAKSRSNPAVTAAKARKLFAGLGEVRGSGQDWEVEVPNEAARRKAHKLLPGLGGYKTGYGAWVLRLGHEPMGDWNDKASRWHYNPRKRKP
jgi:hypothetical protein